MPKPLVTCLQAPAVATPPKVKWRRSLNTRGMYSLVRHPLYLGNYFMWMALVLATGRLDFALLVTLALHDVLPAHCHGGGGVFGGQVWIDVQRLGRHRAGFCAQILGHAPQFLDACRQQPFLCATSSSANTTGCSPLSLGCSSSRRPERQGSAHPLGTPPHGKQGLGGSVGLFLFLRFLKKRTRVLHVEGREFNA